MYATLFAILLVPGAEGPPDSGQPRPEVEVIVPQHHSAGVYLAYSSSGRYRKTYLPCVIWHCPYSPALHGYYHRPQYNYRRSFDYPWSVAPVRPLLVTHRRPIHPEEVKRLGEELIEPPLAPELPVLNP